MRRGPLRIGAAVVVAALAGCTTENPFYVPGDFGGPPIDERDGSTVDATAGADLGTGGRDLAEVPVDMSVVPLPDLTVPGPVRVVLVPAGSTWRYLDDGSNQRAAWRALAFDDSAWRTGPAELGYGDGDEATVVRFGQDPNRKHITTYFRTAVDAQGVARFRRLELRVRRDDGIVVYLNGAEVYRDNIPGGQVDFRTTAANTVGGNDESAWQTAALQVSGLVEGRNVVAAEIHQASGTSSDISFDLDLVASAP